MSCCSLDWCRGDVYGVCCFVVGEDIGDSLLVGNIGLVVTPNKDVFSLLKEEEEEEEN